MPKYQAPFLGKTGKVDLDDAVFTEPFNGSLVHEVARAERNARRAGNASTKTRSEIAMTGAKAWRQKGTGRARVGALSAVQRRGGGVVFGPTPRSYTFKVNRKVRRKALRAVLSLHAERGSLAILPQSAFSEPNTSDAAEKLSAWKDSGSVVVLTAGADELNAAKSFRNIGRVRAVLPAAQVGVYELTATQNVVISEAALSEVSRVASGEVSRSGNEEATA